MSSNNSSNKKLLVDLSKSIMPSAFAAGSAKYHSFLNNHHHHKHNNGKLFTSHFSSPRSSRSSCSTYSCSNSCSTNCTSSSSSTSSSSTYSTSSSICTTLTRTATNTNTTASSSGSNNSSRISLNLSSSTSAAHTCDSSYDCNSNCSKHHYSSSNSESLSSSLISTSSSLSSANSSMSSESSSYYSTDEQMPEPDDTEYSSNSLNANNNSFICNSSLSSAATNKSSAGTSGIAKITRSTATSLKISSCAASVSNKRNNDLNEICKIEPLVVPPNNKVKCMWIKCKYEGNSTEVDDSLMEHIKSKHIFNQKCLKTFRCMWKGCSVFKKSSCSFNWLERHVIDHIDTKPFICIFNGCKRKFRTEAARERHVQTHINSTENSPQSSASPIKTRNHLLNAKMTLIQNIKNKNDKTNEACLIGNNSNSKLNTKQNESNSLNETSQLVNYSHILKALTKKRKVLATENSSKKFKKAQFKDYADECTASVVDNKLKTLNYLSGQITFKANIVGFKSKTSTQKEQMLVEWIPKNM